MDPKEFFDELKRRNVFTVAVAYAVGGWALAEGISQVFSGIRYSELGGPPDRGLHRTRVSGRAGALLVFRSHPIRNRAHTGPRAGSQDRHRRAEQLGRKIDRCASF